MKKVIIQISDTLYFDKFFLHLLNLQSGIYNLYMYLIRTLLLNMLFLYRYNLNEQLGGLVLIL